MGNVDFDEKDIVGKIRYGDLSSFTQIYEAYHSYLYHFSLRFLKSSSLAEEVVHDVFLKLWENRTNLNPELSLKGYLLKICKNHTLNLLQRASREQAILLEIFSSTSAIHNDTEEAILAADLEAHVDHIISQLPPQRQKILRMYRFEEMNLEEIASELQISRGTVKDHMLKANRFIRKYLYAPIRVPVDLSLFLLAFLS